MKKLLRTPIVDINGRHTHVYRGLLKSASDRVIPAVSSSQDSPNEKLKSLLLSTRITEQKCTSRKHQYSGCGASDCPEGNSLPTFIQDINSSPELMTELLSEVTTPDFKRAYCANEMQWKIWTIPDKNEHKYAFVTLPPRRSKVKPMIESVDKSIVPSFDNHQELNDFVRKIYGHDNVIFRLDYKNDSSFTTDTKFYSLAKLYVSPDLRKMGVGQHIMKMVEKFVEENDAVLNCAPTTVGDGSIPETSKNKERWRKHRKEHYDRLVSFYGKYGFVISPAYRSNDNDIDKPIYNEKPDYDFIENMTLDAQRAMEYSSLVRFPNGGVPPEGMFRKLRN